LPLPTTTKPAQLRAYSPCRTAMKTSDNLI
jgi:hypothetical protein